MGNVNGSCRVGPLEIKKPKVLFLVTEDWYFWSHRLPLARAIRDAGFQVLVATKVDKFNRLLQEEQFKVYPISLRRNSKNPIRELWAVIELIKIYRDERPDLVHHVALKPIMYGSIAARVAKVPAIVNAFAGLGSVFIAMGWRAQFLRKFLGMVLNAVLSLKNGKVIFQNRDDSSMFINAGIIPSGKIALIKGSGVDMSSFKPVPEALGVPCVILASRMLLDKGVREFVEAASLLKAAGVTARFILAGNPDNENPTSISEDQLESWKESGAVDWWRHSDNMPEVFGKASIVCLPSYREGLPKVLIEAAASGRAIVATDTPGCREIVRHGENGLLVPIRDSRALADALRRLLDDRSLREKMGARGRQIAVSEFSVEKVISETISIYKELLKDKWPSSVSEVL